MEMCRCDPPYETVPVKQLERDVWPISLTPCISKLAEEFIVKDYEDYFQQSIWSNSSIIYHLGSVKYDPQLDWCYGWKWCNS